LAFWDHADDFNFEKSFSAHMDTLQIYIKYVDYCTTWVTIDQNNVIAVWDLEKERCEQLPKRHEERITDVCEIVHIKLLAACSLDKKIILWDIVQKVPS
jgi:WD40 repeat protein